MGTIKISSRAPRCTELIAIHHDTTGAVMGSRKRSARKKEIDEFKAELDSDACTDIFTREDERRERADREREEALRWKSCERKKRYPTRADAEEAIALCEAHGTYGLRCYKCTYCKGWHLTSHATEEE